MVRALAATTDEALAARIGEALSSGREGVVPGLLVQALHGEERVQQRSLECLLRRVSRQEAVRGESLMIEAVARFQIGSEHPRVRVAAVRLEHAVGIRTEAAVGAVLMALDDPEPEVRRVAAQVLGSWRYLPERCVPRLIERVTDNDLEVRVAAANAIGAFGGNGRVGELALGEVAGHSQVRLAVAATRALGRLDAISAASLGVLIRNLQRPEVVLRASAVTAMGRLGAKAGPEAAEAVAGALGDGDAFVRRSALQALSHYGPLGASGVDDLIGILRSGEEPAQILAAEALGAIGPAAVRAVPALTAARNNNQSVMSRPVVEAIARIQAGSAGEAAAAGANGRR